MAWENFRNPTLGSTLSLLQSIGSQEERPAGGGFPSIRPLSPRVSEGQHLHPSPLDSACFGLGPSSGIPQAQRRWSCGEGGGQDFLAIKGDHTWLPPFP